jgi:hypothetical protein
MRPKKLHVRQRSRARGMQAEVDRLSVIRGQVDSPSIESTQLKAGLSLRGQGREKQCHSMRGEAENARGERARR